MKVKTIYHPGYAAIIGLLRSRREELGLRQRDVAKKLGWSVAKLSRIEQSQRRLDVLETVHLAKVLRLSMKEVLEVCDDE